ncbi:MAG: trigger factor, partial [Solirubrobacterales bacterium]|nr:trigger factor [Solirubrobacterales bacterium]
IEIGVRPEATLGQYKGLEVGRREPHVEETDLERELEQLRERFATLETVDRAAENGDHVVIDYLGRIDGEPFEGGEGRDQLLELGSGRLLPGFEDGLAGARADETRSVEVDFPEEYPGGLAGQHSVFEVTVKEVKAKQLPELDDEFASQSAGFDSIDELREDVASRLKQLDEQAIEKEFEQAVLEAAAAEAEVNVPDKLVHARAHEMLGQTLSALERQGISKEAYLRIADKDEEALAHDAEPQAASELRREAVLAAIVQAEQIEPSEDELLEALAPSAEQAQTTPAKLLEQLKQRGRLERVREDLAARQALELIVGQAEPISVEQAKARQKLWTPGREEGEQGSGQLWTPGS